MPQRKKYTDDIKICFASPFGSRRYLVGSMPVIDEVGGGRGDTVMPSPNNQMNAKGINQKTTRES
jgi:hypothetical protein